MTGSTWFLTSRKATGNVPRVYCFAHAGGNPRLFLKWQDHMGDDAEIVAVCPPGRAHRGRESSAADLTALAADVAREIAATADQPFLLFGHSLGAVVAFETARRLDGHPLIRHVIASAASAPSLLPSEKVRETARLTGTDFTRAVEVFGGLPPEVIANEGLQELLLAGLRADFRMAAAYIYRSSAPLAVPLTLIAGRGDRTITETALEPWRLESTDVPECHWVEGGHFYFDQRPSAVTDVLRPIVRAVSLRSAQSSQPMEAGHAS
ncbi:thioesterase II family protein [Streptomyces sp. NPDC053048]|uniref:thioesterase II family protein n=1 Tax=Streptomyces sp. NPDC053048 TaxID=3365694 RepID=UPI0037CF40C7